MLLIMNRDTYGTGATIENESTVGSIRGTITIYNLCKSGTRGFSLPSATLLGLVHGHHCLNNPQCVFWPPGVKQQTLIVLIRLIYVLVCGYLFQFAELYFKFWTC